MSKRLIERCVELELINAQSKILNILLGKGVTTENVEELLRDCYERFEKTSKQVKEFLK